MSTALLSFSVGSVTSSRPNIRNSNSKVPAELDKIDHRNLNQAPAPLSEHDNLEDL